MASVKLGLSIAYFLDHDYTVWANGGSATIYPYGYRPGGPGCYFWKIRTVLGGNVLLTINPNRRQAKDGVWYGSEKSEPLMPRDMAVAEGLAAYLASLAAEPAYEAGRAEVYANNVVLDKEEWAKLTQRS